MSEGVREGVFALTEREARARNANARPIRPVCIKGEMKIRRI